MKSEVCVGEFRTPFGWISEGQDYEPLSLDMYSREDLDRLKATSVLAVACGEDAGNVFDWDRIGPLLNKSGIPVQGDYSTGPKAVNACARSNWGGRLREDLEVARQRLGDSNLFCTVLALMKKEGYFKEVE